MIRSMREMLCIVIALAMTAGVFMPPQVRAEETSEEELLFGEIPVVIVATKKLEKEGITVRPVEGVIREALEAFEASQK